MYSALTNKPISFWRKGFLRYARTSRFLSAEERTSYIDKWFESIVKEESFYEEHAAAKPRRYFYNIDLQGRLFLEETLPKNIATSIKDIRFLDFFFGMIRPVGPRDEKLMETCGIPKEDYPFVSPCGGELNFIRPACTPIVFHSLDSMSNDLIYGGTRTQKFKTSDLAMSEETGRLYHRCDQLEKASAKVASKSQQRKSESPSHSSFALIRSAIVVSFSDRIVPMDDEEIQQRKSIEVSLQNYSGLSILDDNQDNPYPIPWLPKDAEPGRWALPYSEDDPEG